MDTTKRDWNGIGWIVLAGACGGFLSWVYSLVLKQPLCDSRPLALSASVLFGILAGGIAIYVFNMLDQARFARTFFIAVMFGFVWKPIVEAIPAYVKKTTVAFTESSAKDSASKAEEAAKQLTPEKSADTLKPEIKTTSDRAVKAVAALPEVKSSTETHQAVSQGAVRAVEALGELVIKSGDPSVKKEATEALNKVGTAALSTQSYGVGNAVSRSLGDIEAKSTDPEIKSQAAEIKKRIDALNVPAVAPPQ
jgi:hypothetical protein